MELPALKLPEIHLPFEVPVLLHPPIDHFVIAIPVLVLLIEIVNLIAKKRAIGFVAFFLLAIGTLAAVAAYYTGTIDGKEAFDALTQEGQEELKEHKLLGTYLMLASGVVLIFKLLSSMIRRGLMKAMYLLVLIVFIAGIFKQGKDGGELVYKYGANIERVADLDSDLFDTKEELDEANEALKAAKEKAAQAEKALKTATAKAIEAAKAAQEKTTATSPSSQTSSVPSPRSVSAEVAKPVTTDDTPPATSDTNDATQTVSPTSSSDAANAVPTSDKDTSNQTDASSDSVEKSEE